MPTSPEFIRDDHKFLLGNIKLTKSQRDSANNINEVFIDQQKKLCREIASEYGAKVMAAPMAAVHPDAYDLYLTAEMRAPRDTHELKGILQGTQLAIFDANMVNLQARERKMHRTDKF